MTHGGRRDDSLLNEDTKPKVEFPEEQNSTLVTEAKMLTF